MNAPAKYLFDTHFDSPATPPPVAFDEVEALKQAHRAELEQMRREALQQGRQEGRLEANQAIETKLMETLKTLLSASEQRTREIDAKLDTINALALRLSVAISKKLANTLLASYPEQHIETFFKDNLAILPHGAVLQLRLSPDLVAPLASRLETLLAQNGHDNTLSVVADEQLDKADCRLVWADGGVERRTSDITREIEQLVANALPANQPGDVQAAQTEGDKS